MRNILESIEQKRGGANTASPSGYATAKQNLSTNTNRILDGINQKRAAAGKTIYNTNTPYTSLKGQTQKKGIYTQAREDNRDTTFWEKLRGITGGTLGGAVKTYAADIGNAVSTLGQTLGEINERNPYVQSLARPVDVLYTREEQRQLQDEALKNMQDWSDRVDQAGRKDIERAQSYTGKVGDMLIEAGVGAGQSLIDLGISMTGVGAAIPLVTRVYGGTTRQARQEGANLTRQNLYGVTGGAVEYYVEKLTGGVGKIYGAGATDDLIEAIVGKTKLGNTGKSILRGVINAQGEGVEEAITALLSPAMEAIYKGNVQYSREDVTEALRSYLIGALSGGMIETITGTTGANRAANAILEDTAVQQTLETYWNTAKENGALSKEARTAFQQAASEMATAREVVAIAKAAGIDTEAARSLLEAKKARDAEMKKAAQKAAQPATAAENGVINDENISDEGQGNGLDGIGARGQIGVFPEAAGEPNARISGDQSEAGRGRENPERADLREVNPEELGITGAQNPVMLIDPERAGGSIADAADTVRSVGMEPVAFRGELRVGNASVNGYIEDGRIFFRTDAVDNRGREITAEQIVEHELFHAAAETEPQLVEDVKEVVRERMSEAEFDTMMADYAAAYSKVQDFSGWTPEQIAEYLYQEIAADAYAGINYFNDAPATVEAARAAAPRVGQNQIERSGAETRGPPDGRAMVAGIGAKTADSNSLRRAEELERDGMGNEAIRQETGWYRGMDGQWRFEIDDSGARFFRRGDSTVQGNPDYIRWDALYGKLFDGTITDEEIDELRALESALNGVRGFGVRKNPKSGTLMDYLSHPALYETYPELADLRVRFERMEDGDYGAYSPKENVIVINGKLRNDSDSAIRTLLHEIQHAIQTKEGFAKGASPKYWRERIQKANIDYLSKKTEFQNDPRVRDIAYRAETDEDISFDEELERLMSESQEVREKYDAYRNAELFATRMSMRGESPESLYRNTAGEIEARDTAARRILDAKERKKIPPYLGDENTVFADQNTTEENYSRDKKGYSAGSTKWQSNEPTTKREWSAFNRSLANKTSTLKPGETKRIIINTADNVYFVTATGYMEYEDIQKYAIEGNEDVLSYLRKEFVEGNDGTAKISGEVAESYRLRYRRGIWGNGSNGHAGKTRSIDELDGGKAGGDTAGNTGKSNDDEKIANGRASVEVHGSQMTPQERDLMRDGTVELGDNKRRVEVELQRFTDGWHFRVNVGNKLGVFASNAYRNGAEAAREAVRIGEQYTLPEQTRAQKVLNAAADEAAELPPPVGRFSKAEWEAEQDRLNTLVEADAPWGAGDVTRSNDAEGQAAADEFAQERAEQQAARSMEEDFAEYNEILRGQIPIKREDAAENKVTTGVSVEKEPWKKKVSNTWRSLIRTITNAEDTIHRIGRKTGNKALDGYYFRAMAARQIGTEWITGKRHDLLGRATGKGLNEIFSPIRAKGQDYYEQFQLYLYHMLNIDRMSRDYEAETREAQAEVTRLENIEPAISRLSPETLERIAGGVSIDAQFAKDYMEAVAKRNKAEKRRPKPVFGFDVTADDSRAAVDRLLEKHPEFAELAQDVYAFSNDLMQYRVDAGLIRQQDKDYLQRLYPHYVPTFREMTKEDAKVLHKGGISVSKAIGRATGSDEKLLPLHVSLARQAMTVTKNGTINRLGNVLLETRDANKEYMSQYIREVKDAESGFNEDTFDEEERVEPERKKNVITIIENGKKYDLTLDEGLAEAFEAFEPDKWANNDIAQAAKKVTDIYKKLITAYNPLFVVRNMLKDIQDAGLYSKDLKAWAENFPMAYREIIREGKYWQMYTGLGGNYASIFDYTTGEATADGSGIIGRIEHLNRIVEAAPRMAEFMAMVKKAEARGPLTEADLMEAFEAAQDVTTNFGRAGRLGKRLNKYFVPFLNPGIQGADKFIRNLTERKGLREWSQLVVRAAALGIAPAIINGLLHRDKEDWEEEWDDISEATKANYYLFKLRDGVWLKIPRGRALAVLGAAGVAVSETVKGNEIDPKDLLEVIKDNIAPQNPLEANIFRALLDSKLWIKDDPGRTWYGGEIESEYMQSFRPSERYDASTDYLSRWLGKTFDLSPAKINYLIDQYSGVVGDILLPYITPESSAGLRSIKGVPIGIGIRKNFSVDTVTNNETTGEWYDLLDELDWDENGGDIAAGTTNRYMSKANKVVSDYYRQIREIEADTELNNQEKQELTRALRRELIGYQKEILETEKKYRLAAENYYDDHPELDHEDDAAVKTYMEQYNAQQASEEYYKNEEKTADLMAAIVYREVNREVLGAEYALETYSEDVYERAAKVHNGAAVSYDTYYDYYFGTKDMHADRDENGKSISGTKKAKVLRYIADMEITDEQKDALAIDAGYKAGSWKSYGEGKSGGSGGGRGRGGKKKKTKAIKLKDSLFKPVGMSHNRSMSIAARSGNVSAYEDIQKVTKDLRKKNPWYALPTGNPELDEERPAAARYFETGKL